MYNAGLVSLKPTTIRIAAKDARGIMFMITGNIATATSNNRPWKIADILDLAPASMLAEPLTITAVIGKPPIKPEIMLPTPCAFNSAF